MFLRSLNINKLLILYQTMNIHAFKEKFIDKNFDNILINNNNVLLNSKEHYIQYKQKYIEDTLYNFKEFSKLYLEISKNCIEENTYSYINKYICKDILTKHIYLYTDPQEEQHIQQKINYIIYTQEKLYENFLHYLDMLNLHSNSISQKTKTNSKNNNQPNKQQISKQRNKKHFINFFDKT